MRYTYDDENEDGKDVDRVSDKTSWHFVDEELCVAQRFVTRKSNLLRDAACVESASLLTPPLVKASDGQPVELLRVLCPLSVEKNLQKINTRGEGRHPTSARRECDPGGIRSERGGEEGRG